MQLRYDTQLTVAEYISTKAWKKATLSVCPNHPNGGYRLNSGEPVRCLLQTGVELAKKPEYSSENRTKLYFFGKLNFQTLI